MRKNLLLSVICQFLLTIGTSAQVTLKLDTVNSNILKGYKKSVDSAMVIATAILNSDRYKVELQGRKFPCWNRCMPGLGKCGPDLDCKSTDSLSGEDVLIVLNAKQSVSWTVVLKGSSWSTLGKTCPWTNSTTAFLKNITRNMKNIPVAYALGVNLAHEYLHTVGFCHSGNGFPLETAEIPDPKGYREDVTYRMGWMAYFIARDWFLQKGIIPGLN